MENDFADKKAVVERSFFSRFVVHFSYVQMPFPAFWR